MTLACHEVHPYYTRERRYLPSWRYYQNNHFIPFSFMAKPSGLPPQDLDTFIYLLWFHFVTDFEISCLAKLAKPYHVSCPTYLP